MYICVETNGPSRKSKMFYKHGDEHSYSKGRALMLANQETLHSCPKKENNDVWTTVYIILFVTATLVIEVDCLIVGI